MNIFCKKNKKYKIFDLFFSILNKLEKIEAQLQTK